MHVTEIVKQKQESDEAISVTIRCCCNPQTDSTLTIYGVHAKSEADIAAEVDKHHDRVASKCNGMAAGVSALAALIKKTKTHGV